MKVKIEYTVEITDDFRRSIRAHYGQAGLASRQEIKDWYETHGTSMDNDLAWSASLAEESEQEIDDLERGVNQ